MARPKLSSLFPRFNKLLPYFLHAKQPQGMQPFASSRFLRILNRLYGFDKIISPFIAAIVGVALSKESGTKKVTKVFLGADALVKEGVINKQEAI